MLDPELLHPIHLSVAESERINSSRRKGTIAVMSKTVT